MLFQPSCSTLAVSLDSVTHRHLSSRISYKEVLSRSPTLVTLVGGALGKLVKLLERDDRILTAVCLILTEWTNGHSRLRWSHCKSSADPADYVLYSSGTAYNDST